MVFRPYRRLNAVLYAHRWAYGRDPQFYNYEAIGGDCTNFASQCIYAGTGVMNETPLYGWYYINANNKSPSWTTSSPVPGHRWAPWRMPRPTCGTPSWAM